ncbi:MAG TPA: L-threonylcarbamoyladenylate synthase [Pyrinomonadaceae bacterium]|nr:L-threonylcarbamoyladenylate synthase [Pyrinomonadaceae bacterium]
MIKTDARATLVEAAGIISAGGIVAYRTDTFYGLGADPLNRDAVRSIRSLKGREEAKPILLLISDEGELERFLISRSEVFQGLAQRHWPGPLTLIGLARPELPDELTAGTGTIGVRLPADERVRNLVRICGGALTATSANLSGSLPARSAEEVQTYFPDEIDLIIDSGEVTVAEPSTVVDLSDKGPRIIREGIIKREHLGIIGDPFSS